MTENEILAFAKAQEALALTKEAILRVLSQYPNGLKNSEIGRLLGVNADFLEEQSGWFCYTVLKIMEMDRSVEQTVPKGPWKLKQIVKTQQ